MTRNMHGYDTEYAYRIRWWNVSVEMWSSWCKYEVLHVWMNHLTNILVYLLLYSRLYLQSHLHCTYTGHSVCLWVRVWSCVRVRVWYVYHYHTYRERQQRTCGDGKINSMNLLCYENCTHTGQRPGVFVCARVIVFACACTHTDGHDRGLVVMKKIDILYWENN